MEEHNNSTFEASLPDHDSLDAELLAYYRQQLARYQQLGELVEQAGLTSHDDTAVKIRSLNNEIARHDADAEPLRRTWQQRSRIASPELKAVVDEVKNVLQSLMQATQTSTQSVRTTQAEISVQMQQAVLKQQAARAYGRS